MFHKAVGKQQAETLFQCLFIKLSSKQLFFAAGLALLAGLDTVRGRRAALAETS